MEVIARVKGVGVSTDKLALMAQTVRGMYVDDALNILKFTPTPLAKVVSKVVEAAAANAENNFQVNRDGLRIVKIYADQGRTLKRFRPRARGRSAPIERRFSHLTVIVDQEELRGT